MNADEEMQACAWRLMHWDDAKRDILAKLDGLSGDLLSIAGTWFFVFDFVPSPTGFVERHRAHDDGWFRAAIRGSVHRKQVGA